MIRKNLFLRGFCMAAALALAAGSIPSAGLVSFAAVSEEAAAENGTGDSEESETGELEVGEPEAEESASEEEEIAAAEEDTAENSGNAESEGQQGGEAAGVTGSEEAGSEITGSEEASGEETESEDVEVGGEAAAEDTAESKSEAEETSDDTAAAEQESGAGESEAEEKTGESEEAGTEEKTGEASEAGTGEKTEASAETETDESAENTPDSETSINPSGEAASASEKDEEKDETAAAEEEIPAEGLVEATEIAETLPAETKLQPELLEAVNILPSVEAVVDWAVAGQTVAAAKSKITITNQNVFKTYSVKFSTSNNGAALPDSTVLQAGTTYYVRFDVTLNTGYYVDKSTYFSLNGDPISMTFTSRATKFNFYGYNIAEGPSKTVVTNIAAKHGWPEAGDTVAEAKKNISVTNQDKFKSCNYIFSKTGRDHPMADTDVFQEGSYYLYFDIKLKDGYAVDSTTKITRNGEIVSLGIPSGEQWDNFYFFVDGAVQKPDLSGLKEFVTRFYRGCLGREPDAGGLDNWVKQLHKKQSDGSGIARNFFESREFVSKNYSDEEYINRLYRVVFGRDVDQSGFEFWSGKLKNGMSRRYILRGLASSTEFKNLCQKYDISVGTIALNENRDKNEGVTSFVARIYTEALSRVYDVDGLNYWSGVVLAASDRKNRMRTVALNFFKSSEFKNKQYGTEDTLRYVYKVFLNREADADGLNYWVNLMNQGTTLESIMTGFSNSQEFTNLMAKYGIK